MHRLQDSISERKWTSRRKSHSKHYSVRSEVITRTNTTALFCKHLVKEIKQREQTNRMLPKKDFFVRFALLIQRDVNVLSSFPLHLSPLALRYCSTAHLHT